MEYLEAFLSNKMLLSAGLGWFIAQFLKILFTIVSGKFSPDRLSGGGGMPSSHSATVTGLAVAAALWKGIGSGEFAVSLILAFIVIYDALGVRYTTGRQSRILNTVNEKEKAAGREPLLDKPLEENIGHTLPEIIVGIIIGAAAACLLCLVVLK